MIESFEKKTIIIIDNEILMNKMKARP